MMMIMDLLLWFSSLNAIIAVLSHVRMPAPVGQLFMFDMLGRLGMMIGSKITVTLTAIFSFTVVFGEARYEYNWTPHLLLLSGILNYIFQYRFDVYSLERYFRNANLTLKARGNLNVRAEDVAGSFLSYIFPCSRLAPLIAPSSSIKRIADISTSRTNVDVWHDPLSIVRPVRRKVSLFPSLNTVHQNGPSKEKSSSIIIIK